MGAIIAGPAGIRNRWANLAGVFRYASVIGRIALAWLLSSTGFSLWVLALAWTKPHRLKPVLLESTGTNLGAWIIVELTWKSPAHQSTEAQRFAMLAAN